MKKKNKLKIQEDAPKHANQRGEEIVKKKLKKNHNKIFGV